MFVEDAIPLMLAENINKKTCQDDLLGWNSIQDVLSLCSSGGCNAVATVRRADTESLPRSCRAR